jgi:hypothetical protein
MPKKLINEPTGFSSFQKQITKKNLFTFLKTLNVRKP